MTDPDVPADPQRSPWTHRGRVRADYRQQLHTLDERLVGLGRDVVTLAQPVADTTRTVPDGALDLARRQFARLRTDAVELEDHAFTLVALESPVAEDLREVVALIRAVHDVVRSGRLAEHVIEQLHILESCGVATADGSFGQLRVAAAPIFADAVDAWARRDALAYNDLVERDVLVDGLRDQLLATVPERGTPRCAAAHVLAVRFLERYADHGVALCAHLSWAVTGDRVLAQRVDPG